MSVAKSALETTEELADRLDDPELRIFDTTLHLERGPVGLTHRSGRSDYEARHVPGAGFLDIVSDLSDPDGVLAFTRPPVARLSEVLSRAGVSNASRVVLYSAGDVMWATRAWWLLRSVGLDAVSVLDGGLAKWLAEGRPVCSAPCRHPEAVFRAEPREEVWATRDEVRRAIGDGGVCTLNALPRVLHTGEVSLGYRRAGHIAGSANVPYSDLLEPERAVFRGIGELRSHFAASGALDRKRVVTYCGGGIAATLNAFALVMLGHPDVRVYDGSLDEWSRDPDLPMETRD